MAQELPSRPASEIGTLNEKPLHAAIRQWYARPGDRFEVAVDGFVVDLARDGLLVEFQTRNFASMRRKLERLAERHRVRLVHPIPREKWIVKLPEDADSEPNRRKSPKRGSLWSLFDELVSVPNLLASAATSIEVLLIQEEEVRRREAGRAWRRRGWVTVERRLLGVESAHVFDTTADLIALVPDGIAEAFTTADLAFEARIPRRLAQRAAYCLRRMGAIRIVGKQGKALLYERESI